VDNDLRNETFAMKLVDNRLAAVMGRTVSLVLPEGATNI